MVYRSCRAALRLVAVICAFVLFAENGARAQISSTPAQLVSEARAAARAFHAYHKFDSWPPDREYCLQYYRADDLLKQLWELLGRPRSIKDVDLNGSTGGVPNRVILAAGAALDDELAVEDEINYEDDWDCPPRWMLTLPRLSLIGSQPLVDGHYAPMNPFSGFYIGGEFIANWGYGGIGESYALTGQMTNNFQRYGKRDGFGFTGGYNFAVPGYNNFLVGPYVSFDIFDQTINQTFPSWGYYLGTTTNWMLTAGMKAGFVSNLGFFVYTLGGVSFLNEKVEINFNTMTSETKTVPGFTAGLGVEFQPEPFRKADLPVTVSLQYQHTWYEKVTVDMPEASPLFNYEFKREDNVIKVGLNYRF